MSIRRKKALNYLSNKVLLKELHKSKCSYCEFSDPKYRNYDIIITEDDKITQQLIKQAKLNRSIRINNDKGDDLFDQGMSNRDVIEFLKTNSVSPKDIPDEDIVIRVMSSEHLPDTKDKHGKPAKSKVNFPPFIHKALVEGEWTTVGKSHFKKGVFNVDGGKISDTLANAFMLLVNRFGNKGNWRGYTWLEEMKGYALLRLSQVALQFDESKSDNPFAWYTTIVNRSFTFILNGEKKELSTYHQMLKDTGLDPTYNEQAKAAGERYQQMYE